MSAPLVPIAEGSESARTEEIGPFRITSACFPGRSTIPPHTHDRPVLAFMLDGSFDLSFPGRRPCECIPGSVFIEPAGETHCNCLGTRGARVLVIQPDPDAPMLPAPVSAVLGAPAHFQHAGLAARARRAAAEFSAPDALSPLALEGFALEMLVLVARERSAASRSAPPRWMLDAEALLRERFMDRLTVAEVAVVVGVHPAHLARAFRQRHGVSIGRFVRALRLEWASEQLTATPRPIATIAVEAGYADQSHFTRRFREFAGTTPHRWRLGRGRGDRFPGRPVS